MQASEQLVPAHIDAVEGSPGGVAPDGYFRLVVLPSPFRSERREVVAPVGTSVRELVEEIFGREVNEEVDSFRVAVNDTFSESKHGFDEEPKSGDLVIVRAVPGFGLEAFVALLVVSASLQLAGYATGNKTLMLIGAGIGLLAFGGGMIGTVSNAALAYGSLALGAANLVGSLIAPQPHNQAQNSSSVAQSGFLQGVGNRATPWKPIPMVLGNTKFAPPLGGQQINEVVGDVVWLRTSFCLGYGPLDFTEDDIFLGDTLLSDSEYDTYEVEIRQGFPSDADGFLYSGSFSQQTVNASLAERAADQEDWIDLSPEAPSVDAVSSHESNPYVTTPTNYMVVSCGSAYSTAWSTASGFDVEHELVQWGVDGANEGRGITYKWYEAADAPITRPFTAQGPLAFSVDILWDRNEGNWPKPGDIIKRVSDPTVFATVLGTIGRSIPINSGSGRNHPGANSEGVALDAYSTRLDTWTFFNHQVAGSPERTQTGYVYDPVSNTTGASLGANQIYIGRGDAQSVVADWFKGNANAGRWFIIQHYVLQGGVIGGVEVETYPLGDGSTTNASSRVEGFLFREVQIGEKVCIHLDDNTWQEVTITKKSDNLSGRNFGDFLGWGGPEGVYDSNSTPDPRTTDQMYWTKVEFTPALTASAARRNHIIRFGARWETRTTPVGTTEYTIILFNPGGMAGPSQSTRYNDIVVWHRVKDIGGGVPGNWIAVGLAGDTNLTDFPMENVTLEGTNFERVESKVNRISSTHVLRWSGEVGGDGFAHIRVTGLDADQYDVRVGVGNYGWDRTLVTETAEVKWTALTTNSIANTISPTVKNLSYVNVLLKSTSERTGVIDELRVNAQALQSYYTKGAGSNNGYWTDPEPPSTRGRVSGAHSVSETTIEVKPWDYYQVKTGTSLAESEIWIPMTGISSDLTFRDSDKIIIQSSATDADSTTVGGQTFSSTAKLKYTVISVDRTNNRIKLDRGLDDDGAGKWSSASSSTLWVRTDTSGSDDGLLRLENRDPVRIQKPDDTWFSTTTSGGVEGYMIVTSDTVNPLLYSPPDLDFDGSSYKKIRIALREESVNAASSWLGRIYWTTTTAGENTFTGGDRCKQVIWPEPTWPGSGYSEIEIDMSGFTAWTTRTITQLRLDFSNPGTVGDIYHIDYVAIGDVGNEIHRWDFGGVTEGWLGSGVSNSAYGEITLNDALPVGGISDAARVEFDYGSFKTNSPASAFASVLRGSAQPTPIADSHIDSDGLKDWHDMTLDPEGDGSQPAMKLNSVVDFRGTTFDILSRIASSGRASVHSKDSRVSVIYDRNRSSEYPIQMFTARNIVKGSYGASWTYTDLPHAVRVQYNDSEGRPQEVVAYKDGYSSSGSVGTTVATRFDSMSAWGITTREEVYAYAIYHLKQMDRRNEIVNIDVDIEASIVERGDLVLLSHDIEFTGLASGRIKSETHSGGAGSTMVSVTLDETLTYEQSETYKIRVRRKEQNDFPEYDIDNPASGAPPDVESNVVTFASPVEDSEIQDDAPHIGDVVVFGTTTSTPRRMIVQSVAPKADLSVKLSMVPEAPELFTVDLAAAAAGGFATSSPVGSTFGYTKPDRPTIISSRTKQSSDNPLFYSIVATVVPPGVSYGMGGETFIEVKWKSGMGRPRGGGGRRRAPSPGTIGETKRFNADDGAKTLTWLDDIHLSVTPLGKQVTIMARTVRVGAFGDSRSRVASNWIRHTTRVPIGDDLLASTQPVVANLSAGKQTVASDTFSFDGTDAKATWSSAVILNEDSGDMNAATELYGGLTNESSIAPRIADMSFNVGISESETGRLLRTVAVPGSESSLVYRLEDNIADGGPHRAISFLVTPTHKGKTGTSRLVSTVNEAHPAPKILSIVQSLTGLVVTLDRNWDIREDLAGVLIWASQQSGFTPSEANRIYSGPMREVLKLPTMEPVTWYFRVAAFDCYFRDNGDYSGLVKTDEFSSRLIPSTDTQSLLLAETGGNLHPDPILKYSGEMGVMHNLMTANSPVQYNLPDGTVRGGDVSTTGGWSVCTAENSITPVNGAYMLRHHSADQNASVSFGSMAVTVPRIEGSLHGSTSYDPKSQDGLAQQQGLHVKAGEKLSFSFQANRTTGSNLSSGTYGQYQINFYNSSHEWLSHDPVGGASADIAVKTILLPDAAKWTTQSLTQDVLSNMVTLESSIAAQLAGDNGLLVYSEPDHCVATLVLDDVENYTDAGSTKTDGAPLYFDQFDFRKLQLEDTIAPGAVTDRTSYVSTADQSGSAFQVVMQELQIVNSAGASPVEVLWSGNHVRTNSYSTGTVRDEFFIRRCSLSTAQTSGGGAGTNTVTVADSTGFEAGDKIAFQAISTAYWDSREIQSVNHSTNVITVTVNFTGFTSSGVVRKVDADVVNVSSNLWTLNLDEEFVVTGVDSAVPNGTWDYQFMSYNTSSGTPNIFQATTVRAGAHYDIKLVKR